MAARLNKRHAESTRAKIQTSQLLNRLHKHAVGKLKMAISERCAAEFLVKTSLPRDRLITLPDWDRNAPVAEQARAVMDACAGSVITPDEASKLMNVLTTSSQLEKLDALVAQVEKLTQLTEKRHGY